MGKSITERLRKWKSPSDSYIKIEGPPQWHSLKCNQQLDLVVHCTEVNDDAVKSNHLTIYFQIMAKNNILRQGNVSLKKNNQAKDENSLFKFDIRLTIEPNMSPKAEILVYYIRDDGEIVSDSETLLVDECFGNPVRMKFRPSKSLPGGNVNVELTASPNSLCSLFMTDKSTILLSGREFNPHKIFKIINDRQPNSPGARVEKECAQVDPLTGTHVRDKNILGSQAAFDTIGMMTMTDLFLELNPCHSTVSKIGGQSGRKQYSGFEDDITLEDALVDEEEPIIEPEQEVATRMSFPETWLWELVDIGESEMITKKFPIPHTITKWTGNTFCMSSETGLGVSPRTSIVSFQAVFLTFKLPHSAKKTETVPVSVTVYNYVPGCFPVKISLTTTKDFNLMSSSNEKKMCVCGRKSISHKYHIQPMKVGNVNISVSVSAVSTQKSEICGNRALASRVYTQDTIIQTIHVFPISTPKEEMHSYWICGHGERKSFRYPLKMPSDGIDETVKVHVKVSGDLIAPTVNGLGHLVRLPTGCGSQNMINFAPLVFVTNYLNSTNQLTNALKTNAISHLQSGYRNQLKWANGSGSFSTWDKSRNEGNLRLTAYVIKSFVKAQSMIHIDPDVILRGRNWIASHQLASGCFTEKGTSGVGDEYEKTLELAVTIALLESGLDHTGYVINRAFQCIDRDANPSNLRLAMKAYATALARKTSTAQQLLSTLQTRSIKSGDSEHWTNGPGSSRAINIETTSYVLLAIATLREGHATMAMNTLRWLIGQRTSVGGFSSTEDTVVAIQAIETFASQLSRSSANMEVTFTSNNMRPMVFNVNQGNRLVEQTKRIPMSDALHVATTGQGCALLEIIIEYEILTQHTSKAFYLDVTVLPYNRQSTQPKQTIHICTRYQGHNERTNMVLIEVEMVTGFEADEDQLRTLQGDDINLGKYENSDPRKLVLYFDELKKDLLCFDVIVTEVDKALNVKPAEIKVYDYIKPELSTTKKYTLLYNPTIEFEDNGV